jgi:hypothetical protein
MTETNQTTKAHRFISWQRISADLPFEMFSRSTFFSPPFFCDLVFRFFLS